MFTGIITDIGRVAEAAGDRVVIATGYDTTAIALGASIACSGACLTVVDRAPGHFAVDVSAETRARTAPGRFTIGRALNLERALKVGDELGGHIVTGHVDGVGEVLAAGEADGAWRLTIAPPADIAPMIAAKGSITVDGVSLTVNTVAADGAFGMVIIPHTAAHTTLGQLTPGDHVNLEVDILARYLARMLAARA